MKERNNLNLKISKKIFDVYKQNEIINNKK